jgi:hypothetical protein
MAKRVFKSTKKVSGGTELYRSWDKWSEDDTIIGEYLGTGRVDKFGHDTYRMKVEEVFFNKPSESKGLRGNVLTLNHTGGFGKSMEAVENGALLQIVYKGQNEIQKGKWAGEMAHVIEVDIVEEEGAGGEEEGEESDDDL